MRRSTRSFRRGLTLGLTFALCLVLGASLALAQEAQPDNPSADPSSSSPPAGPPPVGELLVHDPLTGPGVAQAGPCPTRAGAGVFVGEGLLLKLAGRCAEGDRAAGMSQLIRGLQFADGEVKVELRAVNGAERALFGLAFREEAGKGGYLVAIAPTRGLVELSLVSDGQRRSLALRSDLATLLSSREWISLAIVAEGSKLWVVINDQPVLGVADATLERGGVRFFLQRLGDLNSDQETAVVLRDFRLSGLAGGDQARTPTIEASAVRVAVAQPGPPRIGRVAFSDSPDSPSVFENDRTVFSRNIKGLWALYEWHDLPPETTVTTYWISPRRTVGSSDSVFQRRSSTKLWPSGVARVALSLFNYAGPDLRVGSYIFVVELDGVEVARREVTIR